jgi:hypothetical protein
MANSAPATVTTSLATGPGQALSLVKFTDVNSIEVDFLRNLLKITRSGSGSTLICAYDAAATITWTVAAGVSTLAFS